MRFIFDCEDEICLPAAYALVDDLKDYLEKIKKVDLPDNELKGKDKRATFAAILRNMMVKYPKETGEMFSKLWILEDGEKAPNSFKTMSTLFTNEVAVDFFTSVLPSLLQISSTISPILMSKK